MTEERTSRPGIIGSARTHASEYRDVDERTELLLSRRGQHLGGSMLFYDPPVEILRGEGAWLRDANGEVYIDCYNNVQSVGHCNRVVADAIDRQSRLIAVHTRYLHPLVIDYAEALASTMPDPLEVCFFTCSGTEANELAMRIARTVTGKHGAVVMENAYHGNSELMTQLSTAVTPPHRRPSFVATIEPPDIRAGSSAPQDSPNRDLPHDLARAVDRLEASGGGAAAFLCDAIFDSQGGLEAPDDYFLNVYGYCRSRGMICIADEVQAGFGRTGRMWGFSHYDVIPDIVTLGKPIGNGYPLGAVVTSRAIADQFMRSQIYFNTFGGNPVAAAAGMAVLSEIDRMELVDHSADTGAHLRTGLEALAAEFDVLGSVRGRGLYQGVEIVASPNNSVAANIPDLMRRRNVLVGLTGRSGNIVKLRPPLVIDRQQIENVLLVFKEVLDDLDDCL